MKKSGIFLIPLLIFAVISILGNRLFASGAIHPAMMVAIFAGAMLLMALIRPKTKSAGVSEKDLAILGEFAADTFANDPQLSGKFQAALKDYASNMPKASLNKLAKLEPQCQTDADKYGVAMLTGLCHISSYDFAKAIPELNKAVVIHPDAELAMRIGSCQQRLGELKKAKDSYEFAIDLDDRNADAWSSLATVCVAQGKYDAALDNAMEALERDNDHASALATAAICYGVQDDPVMSKHYTDLALNSGYSADKIKSTIDALKKRK